MTVRQYADKLDLKAKDLIKLLFDRGVMATINHVLEPDLAEDSGRPLGRRGSPGDLRGGGPAAAGPELGEEDSDGTDRERPW